MAMFKIDKTKQREIRNAAVVAISAAASDGLFDYVKERFGTNAAGEATLIGKHANLAQAASGAALLAVAPKKRGLAKDLAENIALGLIVAGIYSWSVDTLDLTTHVRNFLPPLAGYAPRHQLAAPALGAYAPRSVIGAGGLASDTQPVI
jgi:hypothetical protein